MVGINKHVAGLVSACNTKTKQLVDKCMLQTIFIMWTSVYYVHEGCV